MKAVFRLGLAGVLCLLLFVGGFVVWAGFGDDSIELHRGNPLHELLLLGNPLRQFPDDLVRGSRKWFFTGSEPSGICSCTLIIRVPESKPEHFGQCKKWLQSAGFKTTYGSSERYVEMKDQAGRKASISIDGNEVRLVADE